MATDRPVDGAWQSDWLRNNLAQNHLAQNDLQRAGRPDDSGHIDLRQTDLGQSDLSQGDLSQGDLSQGDLSQGESAGSQTARGATARDETSRSETTAEQTMPLRRRNSFFGDAPPVDEDPSLLPLAVAPGVFTSKDAPPRFSDEPHPFQFPSIHEDEAPASPGTLRGFAGLTTPPEPTPPEPTPPEPTFRSEPPAQAEVVLQSEATASTTPSTTPSTEDRTAQPEAPDQEREPVDELRHTRSRRAAFGRDPSTLHTSERRRARRHVLPSDESESGYVRRSDDGSPAVGTWLQKDRGQTEDPVREEGWGWAQSGDDEPPRATRHTSDPLTDPLTDGEPLPRRDKSLPTELREEGTGWIAPDVPPSELPSLVPSALVPPSADVIPLPTDRADVLREIRDRARRGTDGTGAWAGHSGPVPVVRENEPKPTASVLEDVQKQEIEDDRQTAVVRPIRDPYEPAENFPVTGAAAPGHSDDDSADTPDGGR